MGFTQTISEVVNELQNGSVVLTGLGNGVTLHIVQDVVRSIEDARIMKIQVDTFVDTNSSDDLIAQIAASLVGEMVIEETARGQMNDMSVANLLRVLDDNTQENSRIIIIVDGFSRACQIKHHERIIGVFSDALPALQRVRLLFVVDVSTADPDCLDYARKVQWLRWVQLPLTLTQRQGERLIQDRLEALPIGDWSGLMLDLTEGSPTLIEVACEQLKSEHSLTDLMSMSDSDREGAVSSALADMVKKHDKTPFPLWWDGLSAMEQLAMLLLRQSQLSKPKDGRFTEPNIRCKLDQLEKSLEEKTQAKANLDPVFKRIEKRGFVSFEIRGVRFRTALHLQWFDVHIPKENLESEIGRRLMELAIQPTEFDLGILKKHIELNPRRSKPGRTFTNPVILHISDVHFGKSHAFEKSSFDRHNGLLYSLEEDMKNSEKEGIPFPNLIVVSGDVTDWGMPDEYETTLEFLDKLIAKIGPPLNRDRVVLVPGNHDINFPLSKVGIQKDEKGGECIQNDLYPYRLSFFRDFYNRFYGGKRVYSLDPDEGFDIFDYVNSCGLLIVGFNSCERVDHLRKSGSISLEAMRGAKERVEDLVKRGVVDKELLRCKIAVWHHDVRVGSDDSNTLVNAEQVLKELQRQGFAVGLHGHVHKLAVPPLKHIPTIYGVGSLGARSRSRYGDPELGTFPLSYNVIDLDIHSKKGRIRVHVREGQSREDKVVEWKPWAGWEGESPLYDDQEIKLLV